MDFRRLIRLVEGAERVPLDEGLSPPLLWKWTERSSFNWAAEFRIKPVIYEVSIFQCDSTRDEWELSFTAATRSENFGFDRSGTGKALTVFGTLVAVARAFVKLRAPKIIKIENADTKRLSVNTRIAKAIAMGTGYEVTQGEATSFTRNGDATQVYRGVPAIRIVAKATEAVQEGETHGAHSSGTDDHEAFMEKAPCQDRPAEVRHAGLR